MGCYDASHEKNRRHGCAGQAKFLTRRQVALLYRAFRPRCAMIHGETRTSTKIDEVPATGEPPVSRHRTLPRDGTGRGSEGLFSPPSTTRSRGSSHTRRSRSLWIFALRVRPRYTPCTHVLATTTAFARYTCSCNSSKKFI